MIALCIIDAMKRPNGEQMCKKVTIEDETEKRRRGKKDRMGKRKGRKVEIEFARGLSEGRITHRKRKERDEKGHKVVVQDRVRGKENGENKIDVYMYISSLFYK